METISSTYNQRNQGSSGWGVLLGILLLLGAVLVFSASAFASTFIVALLGWTLLILGIIQFFSIFFVRHNRVGYGLLGVIDFVIGLLIITNTGVTLATLTLLLALVMTIGGLVRIAAAAFGRENRGWNFFAGLVYLLLGVLIWTHWPSSSAYTFGVLLGIYMVFAGIGTIAEAAENRRMKHMF